MADELNPEEINYYRTRKRQITDTYNLGSAQNTYQQQVAGNQLNRNVGDLAYNYGRMRETLPWAYGARGLLNSGVYQKALANQANEAWVRPLANVVGQYQDQLGGLQLAQQQLGQVQAGGLADAEEAERARIAAVAASLRGAGL